MDNSLLSARRREIRLLAQCRLCIDNFKRVGQSLVDLKLCPAPRRCTCNGLSPPERMECQVPALSDIVVETVHRRKYELILHPIATRVMSGVFTLLLLC